MGGTGTSFFGGFFKFACLTFAKSPKKMFRSDLIGLIENSVKYNLKGVHSLVISDLR